MLEGREDLSGTLVEGIREDPWVLKLGMKVDDTGGGKYCPDPCEEGG